MSGMTSSTLIALLDNEIKNSLGYTTGQLARDREKAIYYYYGQPKGDLAPSTIEGRSTVVDTSVMDTIEWMLPTILRMFTSGDKVVEFQAKREQFEQQAKHATEYIGNHVFKVQNSGFNILHTWFKDSMLSKVGIVKVWWDVTQDESREDYKGLTDIELGMLLQDQHVEPLEHSEYQDPMTGELLHDIAVKRVVDKGFCRIENVPPEEFLISRRAKNCQDSPFTAHRFERTIGQLKEAGYSNIDNLSSSDDSDSTLAPERITRKLQNDELGWLRDSSMNNDPSMRVVWVTECYLKVDYDGDGIPEWRKVTRVGNQILSNEECDGNPFVTITPVPIPHQFFGLSVADLAMEAQRTKTSLMRAMIDNIYLSVNGRTWALEGQVNLDDLLTNRAGGIVRVKSPNAVGALNAGAGNLQDALGMLDYVDQTRENRTGFTRYSQGGNADALNQTATGISIITNKADMRLELIARNFAENGVRPLFLKILELVSKYQDKADRIKATGGWIDIDPREWKNQFTLAINVGLGTGNKDEILQSLQTLGQAMMQAAQAGIVQPNNVYNAGVKLAETLGFPNPTEFFTDPKTMPPKPPQPDPNLMQVQAAIEINKQQLALKEKQTIAKISQDQLKLESEIMMKREELAAKIGIQREELNNKIITQQVMNGFTGQGATSGIAGGASGIPAQPPAI